MVGEIKLEQSKTIRRVYRESDSVIVPMKRLINVDGKGVNTKNNLTGKHFLYTEAGEELK